MNKKAFLLFIFIVMLMVTCNDPVKPTDEVEVEEEVPENDFVGTWIEVVDTVSENGKNYWGIEENIRYWKIMFDYIRTIKYSNGGLGGTGNEYKFSNDTLWAIDTSYYSTDVDGIQHLISPDTGIATYRFSANKDTLYFDQFYFGKTHWLNEVHRMPTILARIK
ncbi:MAG: hypothetical protein Q4F84_00560 [Fibrobacter sp.]|nr:hypothetical protein [Fibrobacter sp.]